MHNHQATLWFVPSVKIRISLSGIRILEISGSVLLLLLLLVLLLSATARLVGDRIINRTHMSWALLLPLTNLVFVLELPCVEHCPTSCQHSSQYPIPEAPAFVPVVLLRVDGFPQTPWN